MLVRVLESNQPQRRPFSDYRRFIEKHYDGLAGKLTGFTGLVTGHETLAGRLPPGPIPLAESGIRGRADLERLASAGYRAFLIGERLLRAEDPEEFLRALRK